MHVPFDPQKINWQLYTTSNEVDYQTGFGYSKIGFGSSAVFHGIPYQRGTGVGSIFRSLLRYLLPLGKQAGMAIGREGLETGQRILSNVLDGKPVKDTLLSESRSGLKNLFDKASVQLNPNNLPQQNGDGLAKYKSSTSKQKTIKRTKTTAKFPKNIRSLLPPPSLLTTNPLSINKPKGKNNNKRVRIDSLGTY